MKYKKGSETRKADYPIDKIFLDRWSPRAMGGKSITDKELMMLFEAARWAPSSSNIQPWRFIYAKKDTEHWDTLFNLLNEFNQLWAKNAAVLVCLITEKKDEYLLLADSIKNDKLSIKQEAEQGKKKLAELEADRQGVCSKLEPDLLKKYLMIKEQNQGGPAVVPVKDAVCYGCNVNLPPQLYNELHRCETLKFCPNCQRIII